MGTSLTGEDDNELVYSIDNYSDLVDDGDWTPAFQNAFDDAARAVFAEYSPGVFGIACWRCGKRMKSHPECRPTRRLDPSRMHPLTSVVLLGFMMWLVYWLMVMV